MVDHINITEQSFIDKIYRFTDQATHFDDKNVKKVKCKKAKHESQ